MNVSKGLIHSREGCGWGLEGENSPPKLLVCVEVGVQANRMQSCCNETWFPCPQAGGNVESLAESQAPMLWFK